MFVQIWLRELQSDRRILSLRYLWSEEQKMEKIAP